MKKPTAIQAAIKRCLELIRDEMARCDGDEESVLSAFSDQIGAEVEGMDMRLSEIKAERGES
jgi:hypothetical protein